MIEAWAAVENALRALAGGSTLSGQALIASVRQRNLIPIDTAHALLEFLAVRERVDRAEYHPTDADLAAVRDGYRKLERALAEDEISPLSTAAPPAPPSAAPEVVVLPPAPSQPARGQPWRLLLAIFLVLVLIFGVTAFFLARASESGLEALIAFASPFRPRVPAEIRRGQEAFATGQRQQAREEFTLAVEQHPTLALPHIYLARIAREEGDWATAGRELATAVQLEPGSALAHRELGAFFLARGDYNAARRAYVRALGINPRDTTAQGYLGCTLVRLGRTEEGRRWLERAGAGSWLACATAPDPKTAAPGTSRPPPS